MGSADPVANNLPSSVITDIGVQDVTGNRTRPTILGSLRTARKQLEVSLMKV